ncbi:hypothetical protein QBC46DRAFT_316249 [Diplogelasinospora grovesii]|uniref:NACHT domain-containing protein n=1 Tax=Diplogelasinospora grovesii TaxID=303347 RepID=A0AAN6N5G0_9PEZI|nr:hypothetical protein QBC46DRAFT_316249 [Diplogelasinospora grovesii]
MDNSRVVKFLQGSDAACWQEAVQKYNAGLKKGASSGKYISLNATNDCGQINAESLMATALRSYKKLNRKRGLFAAALLKTYHILRQYSQAIDVFVQCDPNIASLVWGSIRIGEEEERASRIASEGIMEILRHVGRWEQVSAISDLLDSARLPRALVALYVRVLDFLVSSTLWLKRGTLVRLGVSMLSSKGDKFEGKLKEMRNAAELLDKELQTQGKRIDLSCRGPGENPLTCLSRTIQLRIRKSSGLGSIGETQGKTTFDIHIAMDKIDKVMEQVQDISAHMQLQRDNQLALTNGETSLVSDVRSGVGKSVMAGFLQEHLTAEGSNTVFYRFQRSTSAAQSNPTSFVSSLISQLLGMSAESFPVTGVLDQLQNLVTRFPPGPQHCPFKTIWAVAASLLQTSGSRVSVIIDAMDECLFDDPSLPGVPAFLNTLFESIRETRSKVVIFARPEPIFTAAVESGISIFMAEDLLLPDVMTFARKKYEQLGLPNSEMEVALERVRLASHGSFRWAEVFLDHLGQSLQMADFRARLHTIPPSLSKLYTQSLLDAVQRLNEDELKCRNALLLANFQAQRPLKISEIADAFSLRPDRAAIIISDLCRPLASTYGSFFHLSHPSVREFFELCDGTNDTSLGVSFSDSHGLLAEKCLSCLLSERYADLGRIGSYLAANNDEDACGVDDADARPCEESFYDYASRFWNYHLTRTRSPSKDLLRQANDFILNLQFAYWSEHSRQDCGQLVRVLRAFGSLAAWHRQLSAGEQALVELDEFFERPYRLLGAAFSDAEVLHWLARMGIGEFYFNMAIPDKAAPAREQVLAGLRGLLGPRHRLTLRAKSETAYVRLYAGKMRASRRMYNEVIDIQRDVLGEHSLPFLTTLSYKGQSEYYMADFMAAVVTWTRASTEYLRLVGPDSFQYLAARLWYARGVAYMGQLDLGLEILQSVVRKRRALWGPGDSFANAAQVNVGEIQLLLGRHEESIATLRDDVLVWRRETFSLSQIFRLDAEITLAIAYQAAGMSEAARALVEEIKEQGNLGAQFERHCQVAHLKGILLVEGGRVDQAIHLLQNTVIQAEEDQNNRALLWIRLDLAALLRQRDAAGDRDLASACFDGIVKDVSGEYEPCFADEPDEPRLLAAAEKALRLVRSRRHAEARRQLDSEQLDWRRQSDFWIWVGGSFCRDLLQLPPSRQKSDTV